MTLSYTSRPPFEQAAKLIETLQLPPRAGFQWSMENFKAEWQHTEIRALLKSESELLSLICFRALPDADEISIVATDPKFHGQGFAKKLLQEFFKERADAMRLGGVFSREIWLEVHEHNQAARNLYEKLGFRQVGSRPAYYADQGAAVLYTLEPTEHGLNL